MTRGLSPTRLLCPWGFSRQEYRNELPCPPPEGLPDPGIKPRSPTLQVDSLPSEPPEKPKNIGLGSLSLLQGIFLTQESNQGLLLCRWILYQLSYQGSIYIYMPWYIYTYIYVCVYISPLFFRLPSHLGHHRALSRVPCAVK